MFRLLILSAISLRMADDEQPKRIKIRDSIDQCKTELEVNEKVSPGHTDIFSTIDTIHINTFYKINILSCKACKTDMQ